MLFDLLVIKTIFTIGYSITKIIPLTIITILSCIIVTTMQYKNIDVIDISEMSVYSFQIYQSCDRLISYFNS